MFMFSEKSNVKKQSFKYKPYIFFGHVYIQKNLRDKKFKKDIFGKPTQNYRILL